MSNERYTRQQDLVPISRLTGVPVQVVGTGAVGRNLCIQLAAMGVPDIEIIDFDTVETVNLAPQGFREIDLDKPKVEAVADVMREMNSSISVTVINDRWRKRMAKNAGIVFCCVDDMSIRELLFKTYRNLAKLFIDGRMAAESLRVFSVTGPPPNWNYEETLFDNDQAYQGRCTSKSTIYCASILAGLEAAVLAKWLRRFPVEQNINFNILTTEMEVA